MQTRVPLSGVRSCRSRTRTCVVSPAQGRRPPVGMASGSGASGVTGASGFMRASGRLGLPSGGRASGKRASDLGGASGNTMRGASAKSTGASGFVTVFSFGPQPIAATRARSRRVRMGRIIRLAGARVPDRARLVVVEPLAPDGLGRAGVVDGQLEVVAEREIEAGGRDVVEAGDVARQRRLGAPGGAAVLRRAEIDVPLRAVARVHP